jgi:hypothetical protein
MIEIPFSSEVSPIVEAIGVAHFGGQWRGVMHAMA